MVVSTGVLNIFPDRMSLSAIDPGLVFFGLDRQGPGLRDAGLRPALRALKSRLIQVKGVVRAEFTDRAPFRIGGQMKIGIIPMGRYDGIDAVCCGEVLVRGARVHVLGTPYVEHTRIDLTHVPDAEEGDEVVIIGKQGRAEISPEEVAERRGLSSPGMLALAIRDSVPRVYLRTNCDRASLGRE
jgi:alanine racemase